MKEDRKDKEFVCTKCGFKVTLAEETKDGYKLVWGKCPFCDVPMKEYTPGTQIKKIFPS